MNSEEAEFQNKLLTWINRIFNGWTIIAFILVTCFDFFYIHDTVLAVVSLATAILLAYLMRGIFTGGEAYAEAMGFPYSLFEKYGVKGAAIAFLLVTGAVTSLVTSLLKVGTLPSATEKLPASLPMWLPDYMPLIIAAVGLELMAYEYWRFKNKNAANKTKLQTNPMLVRFKRWTTKHPQLSLYLFSTIASAVMLAFIFPLFLPNPLPLKAAIVTLMIAVGLAVAYFTAKY